SPAGRTALSTSGIAACVPPPVTPVAGDWPQLGGGPGHLGARAAPLAPPLTSAWSTSFGRALGNGGPVVADGTVVVTLADRAAVDDAAVIALDLATGTERWRHRTHAPVP